MGAEVATLQLEEQKRIDGRKFAAETLAAEYHGRLSRSALTIISALIALIGFLINANHLDYISKHFLVKESLYASLAIFAFVFILETISVRIVAEYVRVDAEIWQTSLRGQDLKLLIKKRNMRRISLMIAHIAAELLSLVGVAVLIAFTGDLLAHIVG